jgi:S-adenosylmethionine:tRNA ribosyltransferase-isomerase
MRTREFEYHLPDELIAQVPVEPRDASKLLVINRSCCTIAEDRFTDLANHFRAGDLLILNNTKVIPARLLAKRVGGGRAELFLLKSLGDGRWEALVNPGKKIPVHSILTLTKEITVRVVDRTAEGGRVVQFSSAEEAETVLKSLGQVPLPPYIKRPIEDVSRYQTIYASEEGSVAAPTAALHFTSELLNRLKAKGVSIGYITLHMGLGSFRPIKEDVLSAYRMPVEHFYIPDDVASMVNLAKQGGRRIVACGTDVVRALETVAQSDGRIKSFQGTTGLFITPGYQFKIVEMLITNLHLPRSSHLVLVAAFAGRELIFKAYTYAIAKKFRFYTFGDATLIT